MLQHRTYILQDTLTLYASFQRKENAALIVPDISQDGGTIGGLNSVNNLSTVDAAETKTTSRQYKSVKDNVNHVGETYIYIYIYTPIECKK